MSDSLKVKFISFILCVLFIGVSGCSSKFKYFGNTYPPTSQAKIYFRESDVEKPYEVMGHMYTSFKTSTHDTKVQRKIMDKVQSHGGDGAIFGDMTVRSTGSVSASAGVAKQVGKKKNTVVGGSTTSSKNVEEDDMEIIVIKFKE
jgi:hypothetical protein